MSGVRDVPDCVETSHLRLLPIKSLTARGYLSSNIISMRPLLINLYARSRATRSPRCPLTKQTVRRGVLNYTFPLFTGKAGLADNKKGDIYCGPQQCDVSAAKSQLRWAKELLRVRREARVRVCQRRRAKTSPVGISGHLTPKNGQRGGA